MGKLILEPAVVSTKTSTSILLPYPAMLAYPFPYALP